jgi:dienelactone hydrolase
MAGVLAVVAAVAFTAVPAAASADRTPTPRLVVTRRDVTVDAPIAITVRGVTPGHLVRLTLTLERPDGAWTSSAWFRADAHHEVDVRRRAPVAGDYHGVDPIGLVWSARHVSSVAPSLPSWTDRVQIGASSDGRDAAPVAFLRYYLRPGAREREVNERGIVATFFEPRGHGRRPGVVVVGGSEGGKTSAEVVAALLASHGFATLALAYFDPSGTLPGLPRDLVRIPLEYVATALDWLSTQRGVDPGRLGMIGASRGAELALLFASRSARVRAVVATAPSSVSWSGLSYTDLSAFLAPAWTEHGLPVPYLVPRIGAGPTGFDWYRAALADPVAFAAAAIPVERIAGPILLLNGADDQLWPSPEMAAQVLRRRSVNATRCRDVHVSYARTGHVIPVPFEPTTELTPPGIPNGGDPEGTARASRDAFPLVVRFLHATLGTRTRPSPLH